MQQVAQLLLRQRLHVLPEPLHLLLATIVPFVQCGPLPLVHFDLGRAIHQPLYLMGLERLQQLNREYHVDLLTDHIDKLLATVDHEVLNKQIDVFFLVLLSDRNVFPVGLQLHFLRGKRGMGHQVGESESDLLWIGR